MIDFLNDATARPTITWFLRLAALLPLYGAWRHLSNILSLSGRQWSSTPILWRVLDVASLLFDLVLVAGLIFGSAWAILVLIVGFIAFQFVPHTEFRELFAPTPVALRLLLRTQVVALAILAALLVFGV